MKTATAKKKKKTLIALPALTTHVQIQFLFLNLIVFRGKKRNRICPFARPHAKAVSLTHISKFVV